MARTLTEVAPLAPAEGGDVGGDYQITEAYCRRWATAFDDGTYGVVTVYVYGENHPHDGVRGYGVRLVRMDEHTWCRNLGDPGDTEISSDYTYAALPGEVSNEAARLACAAIATDEVEWLESLNHKEGR